MARDWGKVRTDFWHDEKIASCSSPAKMFALYLLTSPHTNAIGLFRLPVAYMAADTGMQPAELESAIGELRRTGFLVCCEIVPWIWLPNYLKHNPPENANVWRQCLAQLRSVPATSAVAQVAAALAAIARTKKMQSGSLKIRDDELALLEGMANPTETFGKPSAMVDCGENNHTQTVPDGCVIEPEPEPEPEPVPFANANGRQPAAENPPEVKPPSPADPWKAVYDRGKSVFGQSAGGIITNLRKHFEDKPRKVLAKIEDAAEKRHPVEWINAFLWEHGPPGIQVGAVHPLP